MKVRYAHSITVQPYYQLTVYDCIMSPTLCQLYDSLYQTYPHTQWEGDTIKIGDYAITEDEAKTVYNQWLFGDKTPQFAIIRTLQWIDCWIPH